MWSMSQEAFCHTAISSVVIVGQNRSSDIAAIFLNQGSLALNNRSSNISNLQIMIIYFCSNTIFFQPQFYLRCSNHNNLGFFPVWKCIDKLEIKRKVISHQHPRIDKKKYCCSISILSKLKKNNDNPRTFLWPKTHLKRSLQCLAGQRDS